MAQLHVLSTLLVIALFYVTYIRCDSSKLPKRWPCDEPCFGVECDIVPENCVYGTTRDICGRIVCAKGPGSQCGGPSHILGKCGAGMECRCERCMGCSLHTFECDFKELLCMRESNKNKINSFSA